MKLSTLLLLLLSALSTQMLAQQRIPSYAFVNTEYVVAQMPDTKEMEQRLTEVRTSLQTEYQEKQKNLQTAYNQYMQDAPSMADSIRAKTEATLNGMNEELQQMPKSAQATLDNTRDLYMATIYLKVGTAISKVSEEKGLTIVFPININGMQLLLYADKTRDISNLVIEKLGINPAAPAQKK